MIPRYLLLALAAVSLHCASENRLTPEQLAKLDVRLRPLVEGTASAAAGCDSATLADGSRTYRVILRGVPDSLRAEGFPLVSAFGDVCTAALTLDQLKQAARSSSVRYLECGSVNTIQNPPRNNR